MKNRLALFFGLLSRFAVNGIATAFFVWTFPPVLLFASARAPGYLRRFLERRGGAFAKLAQILAMRFDLLPPAYYLELSKVLDRMPPVPVERVRRVIEEEFGCKLEDRFRRFDPQPLGTASIAQVHPAELASGEPVVIKVMRPGIEAIIAADMRLMRFWAWLLTALGVFRDVDIEGMARELDRMLSEELDFRLEAFNAELLQRLFASDLIDHRAPRPYFEHCGGRVVTLERLIGVRVTEIVEALEKRDQAKLDGWAARGIDARRCGRVLYRSMLEQFYRHRVFHGDPHAGNVLALEGGTLGYVDFGNVGRLDDQIWGRQERIVQGLVKGDVHAAYQALLGTLEPLRSRDLRLFEATVKRCYESYITLVNSPSARYTEKMMGGVFLQVADAIRKAGLTLPIALMRFYRAQLLFDVLAFRLNPELDVAVEYSEFLRSERSRRLRDTLRSAVREPDRIANFLLREVPARSLDLVNWVHYKLPHLGRLYEQAFTRFEGAVHLVLSYVRRATFVAALAIGVFRAGEAFNWEFASAPWWPAYLRANWLPLVVAALAACHVLGRIERRLEEPDAVR
jgi:predicted unusual protein kinase regulating ubiquinone biosynthesis (AarF/ABC1/UbiB family)